jgi:uncharacterized ParB-like nuclease family protein
MPRLAKTICSFLTVIAFSALAPTQAQDRSEELTTAVLRNCIELKEQRTAALVGHDWRALERLSKEYVARCAGVTDSKDISLAISDTAVAARELHRPADALKFAEQCMATYYATGRCHLEKIYALIDLNRVSEANAAFEIAIRVLEHNLKLRQQDLERSRTGSDLDRKLAESEVELAEAQLEQAKALVSSRSEEPR